MALAGTVFGELGRAAQRRFGGVGRQAAPVARKQVLGADRLVARAAVGQTLSAAALERVVLAAGPESVAGRGRLFAAEAAQLRLVQRLPASERAAVVAALREHLVAGRELYGQGGGVAKAVWAVMQKHEGPLAGARYNEAAVVATHLIDHATRAQAAARMGSAQAFQALEADTIARARRMILAGDTRRFTQLLRVLGEPDAERKAASWIKTYAQPRYVEHPELIRPSAFERIQHNVAFGADDFPAILRSYV